MATLFAIELLAGSVASRRRAMILVGTFTGLRYGEQAGRQRQRVDLGAGTVTVVVQISPVAMSRRSPFAGFL